MDHIRFEVKTLNLRDRIKRDCIVHLMTLYGHNSYLTSNNRRGQ
jgi:hypothetical protein